MVNWLSRNYTIRSDSDKKLTSALLHTIFLTKLHLSSGLSVKAKNGGRDPKQMTNATRIKEFSLFQMLNARKAR